MAIETQPGLARLAECVRLADHAHASQYARLLEEAERLLAGCTHSDLAAARARDLAAKFERWRYRYLGEKRGKLGQEDRSLVDALDAAANELAGRPTRPPRAARWAIHDSSLDTESMAQARMCLDPAVSLEAATRQAREITTRHFSVRPAGCSGGLKRRMRLYAPLYLSSHCVNYCAYCGFRYPQPIKRKHLSLDEAVREAEVLLGRGFRHILLVAGDYPRLTRTDYYVAILKALTAKGICPSIEIAPQSTDAYQQMVLAGACGITLYQETYSEELYALYHPRGSKALFDWRLEALERAAEAGMPRLGLGILLGLADPREDLFGLMRHASYLQSRFPDRALAFSLPRIRDAPAEFRAPCEIDDELFIRLYCALRVAFPKAELVLSTRESPALRNHLATICITQMSAGSCTAPGGYEDAGAAAELGKQFAIEDRRSPAEVANWLRAAGFELRWDLGD